MKTPKHLPKDRIPRGKSRLAIRVSLTTPGKPTESMTIDNDARTQEENKPIYRSLMDGATRLYEETTGTGPKLEALPTPTPRLKATLAQAAKEAKERNCMFAGTDHLLLALLKLEEGAAWRILLSAGLTYEKVSFTLRVIQTM